MVGLGAVSWVGFVLVLVLIAVSAEGGRREELARGELGAAAPVA